MFRLVAFCLIALALVSAQDFRDDSRIFHLRRDFRKCASPMCGGWFVDSLNGRPFKCVDQKQWGTSCYVFEIVGPQPPSTENDLLVSGQVSAVNTPLGKFGQLQAYRYWSLSASDERFHAALTPFSADALLAFDFYSLDAPRKSNNQYVVESVNSASPKRSRVRLSSSRTVSKAIDSALAQLKRQDEIIVAGGPIKNPRASVSSLNANAVYSPIQGEIPLDDNLLCQNDQDCLWVRQDRLVESTADCFCVSCANVLVNTAVGQPREEAWFTFCRDWAFAGPQPCPQVKCAAPPAAVCKANQCVQA